MSPRRQNSSCDPCRRAKRKCIFPPSSGGGHGQTCLNCLSLESACTFEYVTARLEHKRKRQAEAASRQRVAAPKRRTQQTTTHLDDQHEDTDPFQVTLASDQEVHLASGLDLAVNADFDIFDDLGDDWSYLALGMAPPIASTAFDFSNPHLSGGNRYRPGIWAGSPLHLLNSRMTTSLISDYLDDMYMSMMNGIESRYLTYSCNLYAPDQRYCFNEGEEDGDGGRGDGGIHGISKLAYNSLGNDGLLQTPTMTPESPAPPHATLPDCSRPSDQGARKITFVGLARFLDHFALLYGNTLDARAKKEDEEALIAAQRAFALQWVSCDEASSNNRPVDLIGNDPNQKLGEPKRKCATDNRRFFTTAWFNARSLILNASPHRSFTRVYTMLLFHITNSPAEAKDAAREVDGILSQCLQEFLDLKDLVDHYCRNLGTASMYRTIIESSVKIFHWFGYVRDTMASMVTDRECFLQDAPVRSDPHVLQRTAPVTNWVETPLDEVDIPATCRVAISYVFRLFRQYIGLRKTLRATDMSGEPSTAVALVDDAIVTLDEFDLKYGQFCTKCSNEFDDLSETSKVSSGFLILFWSLGVLAVVEEVQATRCFGFIPLPSEAFSKLSRYQDAALRAAVDISSHISNLSDNGNIKISSRSATKLPLISHHANLLLVVEALVKVIENTIQINTTEEGRQREAITADHERPQPQDYWISSLKPLLSCLLGLDVTVAGSNTARLAFQRLMNSYSDILMDCWAVEDVVCSDEVPPVTSTPAYLPLTTSIQPQRLLAVP